MLYILQGRVHHEYGPGLKKSIDNQAGDFIYIEPGVPHEVFNLSDTEPVVAVVAPLRRLRVGEHRPLRPQRRAREPLAPSRSRPGICNCPPLMAAGTRAPRPERGALRGSGLLLLAWPGEPRSS